MPFKCYKIWDSQISIDLTRRHTRFSQKHCFVSLTTCKRNFETRKDIQEIQKKFLANIWHHVHTIKYGTHSFIVSLKIHRRHTIFEK